MDLNTGVDPGLVDVFDPQRLTANFLDNPYPTYTALREFDPRHRATDGSLFLTRYADCAAVYRERRLSSDKRELFKPTLRGGPIYEHHTTSLVFNDPPYHTRVRRSIQGALIARVVHTMKGALEILVDDLLDRASESREFDLIEDFAAAIPVEVIGNLLRIPAADRAPLRAWSLDILGALEASLSEEARTRASDAVVAFGHYLKELIRERRRHLLLDGTDALSLLINGQPDREGDTPLSDDELVHNAIFLLNAGHETTTNLIGNGVVALLEHPEQWRRLLECPSLISSTVEECLRFESSNQLGNRVTTAPLELEGLTVEKGTAITICIGAANRDPDEFSDPDCFDIARAPNRHLAFGLGIHACAGMALARMEGRVAIMKLVQRFPKLERVGEARRGGRARFRGFLRYPVSSVGPN